MELEPMSRPTICLLFFPPNSPIAASLLTVVLATRAGLPASPDRLAHFPFHPAVQDRFPQFPAVAKLKCGYLAFRNVTVQRIRGDTQILRRLSYVHYFARFHHSGTPPRHSSTRLHSQSYRCAPLRCGSGLRAPRGCFMTFCTPRVKGIHRSVALRIRVVLGFSGGIVG